jgi:hypothetical protein
MLISVASSLKIGWPSGSTVILDVMVFMFLVSGLFNRNSVTRLRCPCQNYFQEILMAAFLLRVRGSIH